MKLYRSNRVEALLDALVEVLVQTPSELDPMDRELVVVHSRGMAGWLTQRLADRLGVWAGADFPFPRRFVHDVFAAVCGEQVDPDGLEAWTRPRLVWSVLGELPRHLDDPAFEEPARYVADDPDGTRRVGLATRIAEIFDQYLVFRPEMVLGWERGDDDHWQAKLWRALAQRLGSHHVAAIARDVFAKLEAPDFDPCVLPARVCVFGLSTLPPFFVRVLAALSTHRPVHLFVVSPSQEYWAEVRSSRETLRAARRDGTGLVETEPDIPPLLASLGTVGRDFQRILEAEVDYEEPLGDLYVEPKTDRLLGLLQSDLLHLRKRGVRPEPARHNRKADAPTARLDPADDSLSLHACHSPMREVEVLHDQIAHRLASDPSLQPRDIVVMASDVETYAPLVEAVFERDPRDPTFIPYCIADRSPRAASPALEAFARVLDLVRSRATASQILDLLTLEAIQERFGLSSEDVDTLTEWVVDVGIRWGVDAGHRKAHRQPPLEANTWRFGLDRLLLGYALATGERATFQGVLPYDEIEGQPAQLLGVLSDLCHRVFDLLRRLEAEHTMAGWQVVMMELADTLLPGSAEADWEIARLRSGLEDLVSMAQAAGFEEPLRLEAVRPLIDACLADERPARGFLAGGVTFCTMLPMRSVPFRVVGLLGMGDRDFPRSSRSVGFDLMTRQPRPGDRSRRTDDRYLFLEALLAARDHVLVCYVGQNIQDNADVPPSVVVSELLDALDEAYEVGGPDGDAPPSRHLVVRHPMQPFSPRYFGADADRRLFSFASHYLDGAKVLASGGRTSTPPPLLERPLASTDETPSELPLDHLIRFYRLPAAELLKRRLRVNLTDWTRDRSDREPMELDGLEDWKLGTALLAHRLEGIDEETSAALLGATGALPLGAPGHCKLEELRNKVEPIAAQTLAARGDGPPRPQREIDLEVPTSFGAVRLVGTLRDLWDGGQVLFKYSQLHPKYLLDAWIRHLVANTDREDVATVLVARGKPNEAATCRFGPVENPHEHLRTLVELYVAGQHQPLLVFPKSSHAFCAALIETKGDVGAAMAKAREQWDARNIGERHEAHLTRLFGDADVLAPGFSLFEHPLPGGDFRQVSVEVFGPLLAHQRTD